MDEYYWDTLDNAAKLVPAVSDTRGSNVFRVSAVLFEEIDPELLQKALERALEVFPAFAVRLRRGLFWYYLDANRETPRVTKESDYPCAPIGKGRDKGFLFRVTYYGKRINLEMFHALSDGMGAAQFLHVIVCYYFNLRDGEVMPEEYIRDYCDRVARDFDEDSFGRLAESNLTRPEKSAQTGKAE
ncbi:MAG: MFS transporter, partial [Candidatus Flemingiibacterium sp.]